MSEKVEWTTAVDPSLEVMWIEDYVIAWDARIALPVRQESAAALNAIERGRVRRVSIEEAQLINDRFVGDDKFGEANFVRREIAARWKQMSEAAAASRRKLGAGLFVRSLQALETGDVVTSDSQIGGEHIGAQLRIRLPRDCVTTDAPKLHSVAGEQSIIGLDMAYPHELPDDVREHERIWNLLVRACK